MPDGRLERAARLPRDVRPYAPGPTLEEAAERAGVPAARLTTSSSNESPLGSSSRAVAAMRRRARGAHLYPSASPAELRAALARYVGVRADRVVVGAGFSALMHAIVAAFTAPGGEVLTVASGFALYAEVAAIHGRPVATVPLEPPEFRLDPRRLAAAIKAFGLADLRLGYAVGTAEAARALGLANTKWPAGALAQAAALADRRHLGRTIAAVRAGRRRLQHALTRLGLDVVPSPHGNYLLVDVGRPADNRRLVAAVGRLAGSPP